MPLLEYQPPRRAAFALNATPVPLNEWKYYSSKEKKPLSRIASRQRREAFKSSLILCEDEFIEEDEESLHIKEDWISELVTRIQAEYPESFAFAGCSANFFLLRCRA